MTLSKPMGNVAAIASVFLLGGTAATNESHINLSIHEDSDGKLLWAFEQEVEGGLLSSPNELAKQLVSEAAKTFPYSR